MSAHELNRKLFRKLMPLLVAAYVISFLDRTNIALAKPHLAVDRGISAAMFGLGSGLFFLTYALTEIPSNLILHRLGARFWITRIMLTWGVVSAAMALVQGELSFYLLRLLLGVAEAGLFPGVMLYLTYWFGREERARATGYLLLGVSFASILGGPLGGALMELEGVLGWHGWQWMFVLEGLLAVAFAGVVWRWLPDRPGKAAWLSGEEAEELERRLRAESEQGTHGRHGGSLRRSFADPQILLAIFVYFCHQIAIYTVIFFLPGIIGTWSSQLSPLGIGSLTALPWIASAIGAIALPRYAAHAATARRLLVSGLAIMAAGLLVAAYAGPALGLLGFALTASMFFVVQSIVFLYPASRLGGAGLAAGLAFVNCCGLLGGFVGPTVMGLIEQRTGQPRDGLLAIAVVLVVAAIAALRLRQGQEDADHKPGKTRPASAA